MLIEVGIYNGEGSRTDGWQIVCEQEKIPHRLTDVPDCPVILFERCVPDWLGDFMEKGGVAVVTDADPKLLKFSTDYVCEASIEYADLTELESKNARVQCLVNVFNGSGLGKFTLHENRVLKYGIEPDVFPVFLFHPLGKGGCFYTGLPMTRLVTAVGDTLRNTTDLVEFSERVISVDKHFIIKALRFILIKSFEQRGLPYVQLWYYPEDYQSAFAFRVDVDGIYGNHLGMISKAALDNDIKVSFYVNKMLCEPEKEKLFEVHKVHEVGNHGVVHNLYTSLEDNKENITGCCEWLKNLGIENGPWFVAPRGLWNYNLHRALEDSGYKYTSDFGYCIFGFPMYPYFKGQRMNVLQIPIDPFSTERAFNLAIEKNKVEPSQEFILDYFINSMEEQYGLNMPVFLYSHPQWFGPMASYVLSKIKAKLDSMNIWRTSLTGFYEWWTRRDRVSYTAEFDENENIIYVKGDLIPSVRVKAVSAGNPVCVKIV